MAAEQRRSFAVNQDTSILRTPADRADLLPNCHGYLVSHQNETITCPWTTNLVFLATLWSRSTVELTAKFPILGALRLLR